METLEQLKAIVKNAPEGATHVERIISRGAVYFLKRVNRHGVYTYDLYSNDHGSYVDGGTISGEVRSLSDIKLIIELMEDKKKAWKAYVALEEVKQRYNGENKIAKALLKLAYECDEFALPSDLRKDIKGFIGDL